MIIGAYGADLAATNTELGDGRLGLFRVFDTERVPVGTEKYHQIAAAGGGLACYSFKPVRVGGAYDISGTINGDHDAALIDTFRALPAGTYVTSYHEPSDNTADFGSSPAASFHAYSDKLWSLFDTEQQAGNLAAGVKYGVIDSHFFWGANWSTRPYYVDNTEAAHWTTMAQTYQWVGLDVYDSDWYGQGPLGSDGGVQRFGDLVASHAPEWIIPEFGVAKDGHTETYRATRIRASLNDARQLGIKVVSYWHQDQSGTDTGQMFKLPAGYARETYRGAAAVADRA